MCAVELKGASAIFRHTCLSCLFAAPPWSVSCPSPQCKPQTAGYDSAPLWGDLQTLILVHTYISVWWVPWCGFWPDANGVCCFCLAPPPNSAGTDNCTKQMNLNWSNFLGEDECHRSSVRFIQDVWSVVLWTVLFFSLSSSLPSSELYLWHPLLKGLLPWVTCSPVRPSKYQDSGSACYVNAFKAPG